MAEPTPAEMIAALQAGHQAMLQQQAAMVEAMAQHVEDFDATAAFNREVTQADLEHQQKILEAQIKRALRRPRNQPR